MFEESAADAWKLRFGSEPPVGAESVEGMLRHRCVRHYAEREVPESLVASLIGAAQSAATSSNLQLWSVVSVQDSVRRNLIADFAGDQHQIREAPWFFAFIVDLNRIGQLASPMGYGEFLDYTEYEIMGIVDCAIAAERMVCAAESAGLGICYIGAMRNDPYRARELLSLPPQTFCPFGLCLGFPAEDSAEIKPRLKADSVWFRESYGNPTRVSTMSGCGLSMSRRA